MTKFEDKLKEGTKDIRLSATKKKELRESIEAYMKLHPLQEQADPYNAYPSPLSLEFLWKKTVPALAFMFLVVFGGIASFAEAALPGDFLYPIKINVNEEVVRVLSLSVDSKAEWEVERIERRVEEIARLKASGDTKNEERVNQIAERIDIHVERAETLATKLAEKDNLAAALDVRADLEAQMEGRDEVINPRTVAIATDNTDAGMETMSLMVSDDAEADAEMFAFNDVVRSKAPAEPRMVEEKVGEEYKKAARRQKEKVIEVIGEISKEISKTDSQASLQSRLENRVKVPLRDMEARLSEGEILLNEERFVEAFELFKDTHKGLNRLRAVLQAGYWRDGTHDTSMDRGSIKEIDPPVDMVDATSTETEADSKSDSEHSPLGDNSISDESAEDSTEGVDVVELIRVCPDEWIVNRMPSIGVASSTRDYFIVDGRRVEIADIDLEWMQANCDVEPFEVF